MLSNTPAGKERRNPDHKEGWSAGDMVTTPAGKFNRIIKNDDGKLDDCGE
jgi:hypothetical protein